MAAVNSEHGGCEPKPPDRCESSFSGPGIQISAPGRLSKGSSHLEAPLNQSVDDKLKYMPMEDFKVLLNVLHEARKDKSKLKSANSEQAEIISELEHHSKGPSHPEEPIQSLNVKFTSSLQSLNHQELNPRSPSPNNYSGSTTHGATVSCSGGGSRAEGRHCCGNDCNHSGDQPLTESFGLSHAKKTKSATADYSIPIYCKNNNNNCGMNSKMGSEPAGGRGAIGNSHAERGPGHPNHNCNNDVEMEDLEEESTTPIQYFFTSKDNTQQLIDTADPLSNSSESDGIPDFYSGESQNTKHVGTGTSLEFKDDFAIRNSNIQLSDEYANVASITGGGINKNFMDSPRPSTPTQTSSSGMMKNVDVANADRAARFRINERASKNKRKPPKGETSVRQEELPGFVGDQVDIEKLVQYVEGRTSLNKKNKKEKGQREVRSKSKEKEPLKQTVSLIQSPAVHPEPPARSSSTVDKMIPSTMPVEEVKPEVTLPGKITKVVVKPSAKSPIGYKGEDEKQGGDEAGSEYTLVKKKRKPKRATPSKESFQRGDQRREPARSRRGGGSRRKSVGSVPGSENSASDGEDSVKSLPADCSSSEKVPKPSASTGGTPQSSYAEIARIARDEEKKKYGSPGSWMKTSGSESIPIDEFPNMCDCENSSMKSESVQSEPSIGNSKGLLESSRARKANEIGNANGSSVVSTVTSTVKESLADKNSPETCRVDTSNEVYSIAPSLPFGEQVLSSSVPTNKMNSTPVDKRNSTNDGVNSPSVIKSRSWTNSSASRDARTVKGSDGKQVQGQSTGSSVQPKGVVKSVVQTHPKVDNNSYLAKAALNVGQSLSSSTSGNSPSIANSQDVGFPALVSPDNYSPPPAVTHGPWSNRWKQNSDRSKDQPKSAEKGAPNPSLSKTVNGLASEHKEAPKNIRSQNVQVPVSPKRSLPLSVAKESPKVVDPAERNVSSVGQEDGKVSSGLGRKEEDVKSGGCNFDSCSKKTENVKSSCNENATKRLQETAKAEPNAIVTKFEGSVGQRVNNRGKGPNDCEVEDRKVRILSKDEKFESAPCHNAVNGEATEAEKRKLLPEQEASLEDTKSCSEKSFMTNDMNSMPVVFCGENFKETNHCLPDKSFGFEFGFGVTEIMDSGYSYSKKTAAETTQEVMEEDVASRTLSDGMENVSSPLEIDEEVPAVSPERQSSPKSSSEEHPPTPPVELTNNTVRTNQTHPTSHNARHKHSSSSTYHRNYQYGAANQQYLAAIPQPSQIPRNMHMMPQNQYVASQTLSRGAGPMPNYAPQAYPPPPHLQATGVPQMNMTLTYSPAPPMMHLGNRNMQDPVSQQGYHLATPLQAPLVPAFSVGMYKVPQTTINEPAAHQTSSQGSYSGGKQLEGGGSTASNAQLTSPTGSWDSSNIDGNMDIAQFFVPLPSTISSVTEREVQKFMDDYVEKLNELCRTGRIKFHRI